MNVCSATISAAPGTVHRAGPRKTISRTWGHFALCVLPLSVSLSLSLRSSRGPLTPASRGHQNFATVNITLSLLAQAMIRLPYFNVWRFGPILGSIRRPVFELPCVVYTIYTRCKHFSRTFARARA